MAKKRKKTLITSIIITIFMILNIATFCYLAYNIYRLSGIEDLVRYIVIGILLIINLLFVLFAVKTIKKTKILRYIFYLLLTFILICVQGILAYFINDIYSSINKMNKDSVIYETNLVVLKESNIKSVNDLKDMKIGYVSSETNSIDNYILAKQIIEDKKLEENNIILDYEDTTTLIIDLYAKDLDAVLITSNYISIFSAMDNYDNIEEETKIIHKLEKEYSKEEIANIEGDDSAQLNPTAIDKPFTVLVMGIDSTSQKLNKNATGNGDALLVITFNPKTFNATILSIPRDTYVPISCNGNREKKINSAAFGGTSCMIKTIEKFLNIDINYYVKINFKGVVNLVDALGGVDVNVKTAFCEQNSSRKWGEHTVYVDAGEQTLNGEQALAFARHRKVSTAMKKYCDKKYIHSGNDFNDYVRGQNQQLVIQAIINKAKTINSPSQLLNILDTISNSMDTNFTTEQILSFYNIAKDLIKASSVENKNLVNLEKLYLAGSGQIIYDESSKLGLWNHIPNQSSVNAIKKAMKANLGDNSSLIKTFNFNADEKYTMETIGKKTTSSTTLYTLVGNFVGKSMGSAQSMCNSKKINCTFVEQESTKTAGTVIAQSLDATKRVDRITDGLTLTIAKSTPIITPPIDNPTPPASEDIPE